MQALLDQKKYCFFDAFGTLFKTVHFMDDLRKQVGEQAESVVDLWRTKQLSYTWLYNQMQQYIPFDEITKKALQFSLAKHQLTDEGISDLLLPIYDTPFLVDGAKELLEQLKSKGKQLAILSNGTPKMLRNGVQQTQIKHLLDAVISVDRLKIYKPNAKVYQMALDHFGAAAEASIFFSSNQWDVAGASTFGLTAVWVNQYGEVQEPLPYGEVWEVAGLEEIATVFSDKTV